MRPPWALSESRFTDVCTRGGDCRRACPEGILVTGSAGFPTVDFALGACTFCRACLEDCDSGALDATRETPWQLDLRIDTACVSAKGVVCRICAEFCDASAIRFPHPSGAGLPAIDAKLCTGCGACVEPCPVDAISLIPAQLTEAA